MKLRTPRVAALVAPFVVALALIFAIPTAPAEAKLWEDKALNVVLRIPDDPYPWEWIPQSASFKKYNIVKGAQRIVDKLRTGQDAEGEGAMLHLVAKDAPKDATLDGLAADKDIQKFLLDRFKKSGDLDITEFELYGDVPARLLAVDGESKNFKDKLAPCRGVMIVVLLRGKLYLMRMYAWHTEYDAEGLKADLDYMEAEGIEFLNVKEDATPGVKPADDNGGGEAKPEVVGKEETIRLKELRFEMVKHAKLQAKEMSRRDKKSNMILAYEGSHRAGSYQLFIYATPTNRVVNGVQAGAEDLQTGITQTWYKRYLVSHPIGTIFRYKWPRRGQFLTLPDMSEENRVVLFDGERKKRENRPSTSEIYKLDIVEKVKDSRVGETKGSPAYRGNMQGNQKGLGKVTTFRYSFGTKDTTYRIIVTITLDGDKLFADPVRQTLESIKIYKKTPKDWE